MVTTRRSLAGRRKCLVTGGAGFLGKHLVQQLQDSGRYDVSVFDIRDAGISGVQTVVGDLRDQAQVEAAVAGCDTVFHCATAAPAAANTANKKLMHDVNVRGTENIIAACESQGVARLVYTSSASVVFDGRDLINVNEDAPYAARPIDYYTETKVLGEKLVLAANGRGGLATVALRPSGIFGEGDPLLVPLTVAKAKEGKMKFIIGSGENLMDFTYVGNVAQAHLQAADALAGSQPACAGKAYFITNAEPRPFWGFLGDLLEPLGYQRPSTKLPWRLIFFIAVLVELIIWLLKPFKTIAASEFTPMRIRIAKATRQLDCSRACQDLGYAPKVAIDEALQRTVKHFSYLSTYGNGPS
ncbi:hypothetical protein CVIRNUC_005526 [Coccomyxa viridis]|uniref:3-beta hydroxysteroid dehydrogenase/isomerase domain-containing protein n=1 Tax=Coccomyxa viridis TaxID=1274662 RepID=A0AAV1I6G9_9CHLO|nr:hypothetical protein CVIRNUC_005526 [Coccomyxa viridis]